MMTLSVQQPWGWAIIFGPKRIENRSWRTNYRGQLLIHAGKSRIRLGDEGDSLPGLPAYGKLIFGAIIGKCTLADCVPFDDVRGQPFAEGPWCWILKDVEAVEPVPYSGRQGLFMAKGVVLTAKNVSTATA